MRHDGSYQSLPRVNTNPALGQGYQTEYVVESQPIVEVKTVETVQAYPAEQYNISYTPQTNQGSFGGEIRTEQAGSNFGQASYAHSETFGRRSQQDARMARSNRPAQELQQIQSRIHRSDIIAHSPVMERPVGFFPNVEHYEA